jgi:regulatory protein
VKKESMSAKDALLKSMNWCSKMERSTFDVQMKLYSWGIDAENTKTIIKKLEDEGFINSGRYIEAYIKGKLIYKKWGRVKIKYHLKVKGFKEEIIDKSMDELINDDEYLAMILEQLRKKNVSINEEDEYLRKSKVINFGASRGYETELSLQCVDILFAKK